MPCKLKTESLLSQTPLALLSSYQTLNLILRPTPFCNPQPPAPAAFCYPMSSVEMGLNCLSPFLWNQAGQQSMNGLGGHKGGLGALGLGGAGGGVADAACIERRIINLINRAAGVLSCIPGEGDLVLTNRRLETFVSWNFDSPAPTASPSLFLLFLIQLVGTEGLPYPSWTWSTGGRGSITEG